jgi:pyruvate dehydrogenase E1 component alpha subunit
MAQALNTDNTPDPEDLFRYVYSQRTPQLEEQWQTLRDELARTEEGTS